VPLYPSQFKVDSLVKVMGQGQKFLTRVESIFCGPGKVSHLWLRFEFGKVPLKMSNFSISFPSCQKILFGSDQRRIGPSFIAGQK